MSGGITRLISLPPAMAAAAESAGLRSLEGWTAASDPPDRKLGSGGGTVNLLLKAWERLSCPDPLEAWLHSGQKLVVHGGGESRRLPAFSVLGKPLIPVPRLPGETSFRPDRILLDLQRRSYEWMLRRAPWARMLVGSGDVLLQFSRAGVTVPEADIVIFGASLQPDLASQFGVLLVDRRGSSTLELFLQKPSPAEIDRSAAGCRPLVDTGAWLLGDRAIEVLLKKSLCRRTRESYEIQPYELYAGLGPSLGRRPAIPDSDTAALSVAVTALPSCEFYHFGSTLQLEDSLHRLTGGKASGWNPGAAGNWNVRLPVECRLDAVPVVGGGICIRPFGAADTFRGELGAEETIWMGKPACQWLHRHGVGPEGMGISPHIDIYEAPIFPVVPADENPDRIQWLVDAEPRSDQTLTDWWMNCRRLSARDLLSVADIPALLEIHRTHRFAEIAAAWKDPEAKHFMDLAELADRPEFPESAFKLRGATGAFGRLEHAREHMFRAEYLHRIGQEGFAAAEETAFRILREGIVDSALKDFARPRRSVLDDQIVWSRAPARLDLAGGWTDTPPYCLLNGGSVLNAAVNLNGQPPIQVFAKLSPRPEIVIRSIDLGSEERISTYEQIAEYANPRSDFSLARAALAAAGFHPRFAPQPGFSTLREQLEDFGSGIEISLLAAVPQGSGLGTSSILAVTLLGALNELCGLGWSSRDLVGATMALEQLVTTGGGWQDQAGGLLRGIKLLESEPGLPQIVHPKWLPEHLFTGGRANRAVLLYYTGITRLAKNILQEVVRGMFLNEYRRVVILQEIGENARSGSEAIQHGDWSGLCASVRESWHLNQELDSGTNPPEIAAILEAIDDYLEAAKLLGAGGGGYLLLFAKDDQAGGRIRRELSERPPNARARFVNFEISETGLEVTRS